MRTTRYEEYTETRTRTVETLTCNACGETVDVEPTRRPEGWTSMQRVIDGAPKAYDFDTWSCVVGFIVATDEDGPGSYIEDWQKSIDMLSADRPDIEREVAGVIASGEMERNE